MPSSPINTKIKSDLATLLSRVGVFIGRGTNQGTLLSSDASDVANVYLWVKLKEFVVNCRNGSTFYITWNANFPGGDVAPKTAIYVNGVIVIAYTYTAGSGNQAFTQTITGINDGDTIAGYCYRENSGGNVGINTMRLIGLAGGNLTTGTL